MRKFFAINLIGILGYLFFIKRNNINLIPKIFEFNVYGLLNILLKYLIYFLCKTIFISPSFNIELR